MWLHQPSVETHIRGREPGDVEHLLSSLGGAIYAVRCVIDIVAQFSGGSLQFRGELADRVLSFGNVLCDGCLAVWRKGEIRD